MRHFTTAAYRITYHLQHKIADLDAKLSSDDRALLIALLGLVESRLAAATNYFTWVDRAGFSEHTRHAYGAAFPAPLSYLLPWLWRRRMVSKMPGFDSERAISGAADAYAALASHLSSKTAGKFFFGRDAQPALVIGRHYVTERDSAPVQYTGVV